MKGRFIALVVLILGVLLVGVLVVFPVCATGVETVSGTTVPMRCYWTAQVTTGVSMVVCFAGVALCFLDHPAVRMGMGVMLAAIGVFELCVPAVLVGVCPGETMTCHMATAPALYLVSGLLVLVALAMVIHGLTALKREAALAEKRQTIRDGER